MIQFAILIQFTNETDRIMVTNTEVAYNTPQSKIVHSKLPEEELVIMLEL